MGICASCLGWDKEEDEDSTSPLLFDDPVHTNYGSIHAHGQEHTPPPSTAADTRNDKELETIVNLAAQKLIPIYDSPDSHAASASPYGELVRKFSSEELGMVERVEVGDDGWGSESEEEEGGGRGSYAEVVRRGRADVGPCTTTLKASEAR